MKLTNELVRKAVLAAKEHAQMAAKITEAFQDRYGTTHSDVDCDHLIEALDYGIVNISTVSDCDKAMALCGISPIVGKNNA